MRVKPIEGYSFGAVIEDFDVAEALRAEPESHYGNCKAGSLQERVVDAFDKYGMLVIKNQKLTPQEELAFAKWFPYDRGSTPEQRAGPYQGAKTKDWKLRTVGCPEVQCQGWGPVTDHHGLSGFLGKGARMQRDGSRQWHTDGLQEIIRPPVYTSMYAIEVPPEGGDTVLINANGVWEQLTPGEQEAFKGLRCRYSRYDMRRLSRDGCEAYPLPLAGTLPPPAWDEFEGPPGDVVEDPHPTHPLFRKHPRTGKVALMMNALWMEEMEGLERVPWVSPEDLSDPERRHAVSAQIMARLTRLAQGEEKEGGEFSGVYAHKWDVGDLLIWDNRSTLHSADRIPEGGAPGTRLMHRIRMASEELPVGVDATTVSSYSKLGAVAAVASARL